MGIQAVYVTGTDNVIYIEPDTTSSIQLIPKQFPRQPFLQLKPSPQLLLVSTTTMSTTEAITTKNEAVTTSEATLLPRLSV